jgi:uncharacterized protein
MRVVCNEDHSRYELHVGGQLMGVADFVRAGPVLVIPHTETHPAHRGQGLGAILVAGALDDVRARGLKVRPACWFVAEFIDLHPEYADLVA